MFSGCIILIYRTYSTYSSNNNFFLLHNSILVFAGSFLGLALVFLLFKYIPLKKSNEAKIKGSIIREKILGTRILLIIWSFLLLLLFLYFIGFNVLGNFIERDQPPLSVKEILYFRELEKQCNCSVSRLITAHSLDGGFYYLDFDSVPSSVVNNRDSLKKASFENAKKLHLEVLGEYFNYKYEYIIRVSYLHYPIEDYSEDWIKFYYEVKEKRVRELPR